MIDPRPAGRDHHDLGGAEEPAWAARSRSARSCSSIAATDGDWVLEVEVPDDDMGPVLAAQSKLEAEIAAGKKQPGSTLAGLLRDGDRPRAPLPGYVRRIASKAETVETEARRQGDRRLQRGGPQGLPVAEPGAAARVPRSGPGSTAARPRLAYVLLRNVVQVFYESVLFRWPFLRLTHRPTSTDTTRRTDARPAASDGPVEPIVRRAPDRSADSIALGRLAMPCPEDRRRPGRGLVTALPSPRSPRTARPRRRPTARRWSSTSWPRSTGSRSPTSPPSARASSRRWSSRSACRCSEGQADRLPAQRDRRADRRQEPSSWPSNIAADREGPRPRARSPSPSCARNKRLNERRPGHGLGRGRRQGRGRVKVADGP